MLIPTLHTARLTLRPFDDRDLLPLHGMLGDREVIRYMPRAEPWPLEVVQCWIDMQAEHWHKHGFGWFAVDLTKSRSLIGWCGLNVLEETGKVEVLYLFDKPYWGQGLATEATRRCIAAGLEQHDIEQIIGLTHPDNSGSQRVLQKCGLRFANKAHYFGMDLLRFAGARQECARAALTR